MAILLKSFSSSWSDQTGFASAWILVALVIFSQFANKDLQRLNLISVVYELLIPLRFLDFLVKLFEIRFVFVMT